MSDTVSITTTGPYTTLAAPHDPNMPALATEIGGRWDAANKLWLFDSRDEDRVRALAREVYGTDGSSSDRAGVTIHVPAAVTIQTDELRVAGRRLAWRPSRDGRVRFPDGVIVLEGGFDSSAGSINNPRLGAKPGTILEVRDVPADQAERILAEISGARIVDGDSVMRQALTEERERLLTRLAEIDAQLGHLR